MAGEAAQPEGNICALIVSYIGSCGCSELFKVYGPEIPVLYRTFCFRWPLDRVLARPFLVTAWPERGNNPQR